ncbi:phenylacetate--CoA ligase family protein [Paraburkholderia saeva]|uniref:phenylacetate--CoA ligase family protein n=1 Tax=Paraburkholderia saeva TaxID=2777537 RepID=UPI001D309BBB|nr:AMP-binding protein [Paraburkholderia saeva]CAG4895777.1 Phenylacetate-coenzyme A ligase [Paraburkholderia saeva]
MTTPRAESDRYFDPHIETMPRDQLERLQEVRILQLVPYVYQRSALIREVWDEAGIKPSDIRSLADFKKKVPFIDKDRIRRFRDTHNDPFGGLRCADAPHLRGVGFTSGTTGDPTPLPRSEHHIPLNGLQREMWHMGARPHDYMVYSLFTFREGLNFDKFSASGIRPVCVPHLPFEAANIVAVTRQFRPTTLFMLSTPLIMGLQQYQQKTGDDLREAFSSCRGAVFGGEPLSQSLRQLVESWGLEIFQLTSLGDISTCMECSAHDGMHTWEDLALVEHLDPSGNEPVPDGARGEMVVTALADDVGPLVRFRTDDLVEYTSAPCTCGRTHGRIRPLGRKGDEMLIQGRSVLPLDIFPLMHQFPATQSALFQLVRPQREADVLKLRVGYAAELLAGSKDELADAICAAIRTALGVAAEVELVENAELLKNGPPNKIPRVTKA